MCIRSVGRGVLAAALLWAGGLSQAEAASYRWFWQIVPARIADGSRDRAIDAVAAARDENRRGLYRSSRQAEAVLGTWTREIATAAHASRLSEALLAALVMVESAGNAKAVSHAGAQGLGQLMPGTARHLGVRDAFHPAQNLRGAAAYLSDLLDMFGGDLVLALAAYNAGEGAVMRHKGVPPYAETRAYVPKVLSAFLLVQSLCAAELSYDPRTECPIVPVP
ncbi:MAG: transglycosylase SLT domain-containing protein [Pseudomonadota bacterium]